MAGLTYLDFDLLVERSGENAYRARVLASPGGQAIGTFSLPFSSLEVENFLLRVGRPRRGLRRLESPEMEATKVFGGKLFKAVFTDELLSCLHESLDEAKDQHRGLRLRLRLNDAPELMNLPWEYLYNPALNRFMTLSASTPVVRYLEMPERIQPLAVKPPLRILAMISSPADYPPLEVEREWENLKTALAGLEKKGLLVLERLESASPVALQHALRRSQYHIFHFIGHGGFLEQAQDGVLLLTGEDGHSRPVSGQFLGTILHDQETLRLAVLNACEGARAGSSDPYVGVAQSLVQQGLPAVIAMQFEVTDEAAITFAREFYTAIAEGFPVDAALAEARKAIYALGNDIEWGTPVLYMRAPDGRIFDVAALDLPGAGVSAPAPEPAPVETTPVEAGPRLSPAPREAAPAAQPAAPGRAVPQVEHSPEAAIPAKPAVKRPIRLYALGGFLALALLAFVALKALTAGPKTPEVTPTLSLAALSTATLMNEATPEVTATASPSVTPLQSVTEIPTSTRPAWQYQELYSGNHWISSVAFSPDGEMVAAGSYHPAVYLLEAATGNWIHELADNTNGGHTNGVRSVAFSKDGRLLASGSKDRTIRIWNSQDGTTLHILKENAGVWSVAFSPKDQLLAAGYEDGYVRLWNPQTGELLQILNKKHNDQVTWVAISHDGKLLASVSKKGQILVWQLPDGRLRSSFSSGASEVWSIAFSIDSQYLAYGSEGGVVWLHQVVDGTLVRKLQGGHSGGIDIVAFSPDGQTLASGAKDDHIVLWDIAGETPPITLIGHSGDVEGLSFSPDGKTLASGSYDGSVRLWNLEYYKK